MEDITIFFALMGLIFGIIGTILSIINTIIQFKNRKRTKILAMIPTKKRIFEDLLDMGKDLDSRIEFTKTKKRDYDTIFWFSIRVKGDGGYISLVEQKILIRRFFDLNREVYNIYGFKTISKTGTKAFSEIGKKIIWSNDNVSVPNDMLPEDSEDLKKEFFIENIKEFAIENGVKLN